MSEESNSTIEANERAETDATSRLLATVSGAAKVIGKIDQADTIGVLGENTASSGTGSHGVKGVTDSEADGVAGVKGEARAQGAGGLGGHESYGVHGISRADSSSDAIAFPAGVRGEATGDGVGRGVVGITSAANGYGGLFENQNGSGFGVTGVKGVSYSFETNSTGVQGSVEASTGEVFGVTGIVTSETPTSAGVRGAALSQSAEGYGVLSDGDSRSEGLFEAGNGVVHEQRGDPGTDELDTGEVMVYNSDGSTGSAGDLVYAINDGGVIKTQVVAARSDAS